MDYISYTAERIPSRNRMLAQHVIPKSPKSLAARLARRRGGVTLDDAIEPLGLSQRDGDRHEKAWKLLNYEIDDGDVRRAMELEAEYRLPDGVLARLVRADADGGDDEDDKE